MSGGGIQGHCFKEKNSESDFITQNLPISVSVKSARKLGAHSL